MNADDVSHLAEIKKAESLMESAMWESRENEDYQTEIDAYLSAKEILEGLNDLSPNIQRERDKALSYCLMRTDEALVNMGKEDGTINRLKESLDLAEKSEDSVQIARCHFAIGIRLLNQGDIPEAESNWREVFRLAEGHDDNEEMQQVLGWTLLARAHVVNAKSLYKQAHAILLTAETKLISIKNYAGLAAVHNLLAQVYASLGDSDQSEISRKRASEYNELATTERR
jgi:tetratricopeptide (TPR) repeat protein